MKRLLVTLSILAALGAAAAGGVIYAGIYDISATSQHLAPTYRILDLALRRAIKRRAADIVVPPLDDPEMRRRGLALFDRHCVQCHGAPGVAAEPFALGLKPAAANLAFTAREWPPAEIFWTIQNGIKMTGMPAWKFRMSDGDIWATVAFLRTLPSLTPESYQAQAASAGGHEHTPEPATSVPDPRRGRIALQQYACVTCHSIPGLVGPDTPVGPPLDGIGSRASIAGALPNEPGNLEHWLRHPQEVSPHSAMPDLGVTARDAADMAAYLSQLR